METFTVSHASPALEQTFANAHLRCSAVTWIYAVTDSSVPAALLLSLLLVCVP